MNIAGHNGISMQCHSDKKIEDFKTHILIVASNSIQDCSDEG